MARQIAYGVIPILMVLLVGGAALGQGMHTLKPRKRRSDIAPPILLYGSTHRVRIITLRAIRGTVARSAVVTPAKLKPTKMACRHGQIPASAWLCAVP